MRLTMHEKVIVGCSSVGTAVALIMVAEGLSRGSFEPLVTLVAVFSGLTMLSTLRGARQRGSGPPAP